jgi:hypothetical protein
LSVAYTVHAANTGFDDASNAAYNDGWQTGDNGGSGFGGWILNGPGDANVSHGGFVVGSSSGNAGGSSGNIDTGGRSWGMYANSAQGVEAIRPLTGGSLLVGQKITLSIDTGFINSGSQEGFALQAPSPFVPTIALNRLQFFFTGGDPSYTLVDNTGSHNTGIPFTGNGLSFAFTLTGVETYSLDVTPNDGATTNFTGTLSTPAGSGIDRIRFFDFNEGSGQSSDGDFFANILTVPEASPRVFFVVPALLGIFFLRRRRVA